MASGRVFLLVSLALFAVINAAAMGKPKWQGRIIGGWNARENELRYMAGIFHLTTSLMESMCGGAILSNRVILTSASCMSDSKDELDQLLVALGSSPLTFDDESPKVGLDHISTHPKYNAMTKAFDLALIRTNETIQFNVLVKPIALPKTDSFENSAIVSGYGLLKETVFSERGRIALNLQTLFVIVLNRVNCILLARNEHQHEILMKLTDDNVCVSTKFGRGLCTGDGGSPLVSNGILIGVASWTESEACAQGFPDVYTKTYPHLEWIHHEMIDILERV